MKGGTLIKKGSQDSRTRKKIQEKERKGVTSKRMQTKRLVNHMEEDCRIQKQRHFEKNKAAG